MALTPNAAYAAKQPFVDKETLEHIVEQFPTPFHLYDEAGIRRNMQEVRDAFAWNTGFKEYFAVKANPNPALISILNEYGCGCDCSSYTELMIARSLGITGHDIMFSSNDTPAADFELADKLGARLGRDGGRFRRATWPAALGRTAARRAWKSNRPGARRGG